MSESEASREHMLFACAILPAGAQQDRFLSFGFWQSVSICLTPISLPQHAEGRRIRSLGMVVSFIAELPTDHGHMLVASRTHHPRYCSLLASNVRLGMERSQPLRSGALFFSAKLLSTCESWVQPVLPCFLGIARKPCHMHQ